MSEPMGWASGMWRFIPHFLIWAAIPNIVSYALYSFGVSNSYLAIAGPILLVGFVFVILVSEFFQWRSQKETGLKGLIDFMAKVSGFIVGLIVWQFWYF
jgi:hypothetical protein